MSFAAGFAVGAVVLGLPTPALASGFDVPTVGNSQSGPVTADASAVYWNPGQLGFMPSARAEVGAQLIVGHVSYQRVRRGPYQTPDGLELQQPVPSELLAPDKTGRAAAVSDTPIAGAGSVFVAGPVWRDRLWLGGGIYAPYAAILDFPNDGPQKWQHTDVTLLQAQAELAIAARLHDRVSLGAGVSYVNTVIEFARVQDFGALDVFAEALASPPLNQPNDLGADAPTVVRELDTLARPVWVQRGISHGVTFNVGLAVKPTDRIDLGLNYQHSNRVVARGQFVLDMNDPFFTDDLESQGLDFEPTVKGKATIRFTMPKRLTLGIGGYVSKRWWLHGLVAYAFWSDFESMDITLKSPGLEQPELGLGKTQVTSIPKRFQDAVDVKMNAWVKLSKRVGLSAGLGYASPAAPEQTVDAVTPDGHHLTWTTGVTVDIKPRLQLVADLAGNHILPRTVTQSDYDLANGEYRLFIGAMGVHLRIGFGKPVSERAARHRSQPDPPEDARPASKTVREGPTVDETVPPAPEGRPPDDGRGVPPPP